MHARLVLLHRRPTCGQRKNRPLRDGTRKVTAWAPRHDCAGRQRGQSAASGLFSEKNASCGEGKVGILPKRLSGLEQTTSGLLKTASGLAETTSPLEKTISPLTKTTSPFEKTISGLAETTSPFWKTISRFGKRISRLDKTISPFPETISPFPETTSPFAKTTSRLEKTISLFGKTTSRLEKTTSPLEKTTSPFGRNLRGLPCKRSTRGQQSAGWRRSLRGFRRRPVRFAEEPLIFAG